MTQSKSPSRASLKNRFPISLHHRLDQKLFTYAAAAGAAGVGMMALPQPSRAEIVYTPTQQTIRLNGTLELDLNKDGIADFTLHNRLASCAGPRCSPEFASQELFVTGPEPNGVRVSAGSRWAPAFPAGKNVGPGNKFSTQGTMERCATAFGDPPAASGPWLEVRHRYLGLTFSIDGQTHYGWARLSVLFGTRCRTGAVLTGYAYETVPGKAIMTGKTSGTDEVSEKQGPEATLGALAQGSTGLAAWRRDDDADGFRM